MNIKYLSQEKARMVNTEQQEVLQRNICQDFTRGIFDKILQEEYLTRFYKRNI